MDREWKNIGHRANTVDTVNGHIVDIEWTQGVDTEWSHNGHKDVDKAESKGEHREWIQRSGHRVDTVSGHKMDTEWTKIVDTEWTQGVDT